jgi:hypothetical protein
MTVPLMAKKADSGEESLGQSNSNGYARNGVYPSMPNHMYTQVIYT